MFDNNLYPINKGEYIRKRRSKDVKKSENCILCGVRDKSPDVESLEVFRKNGFIVSVNLYPYNPGHLLIFPERHVEDIRDLTIEEQVSFDEMTILAMNVLEAEYKPQGFNIGLNIGKASGASIEHLHKHIVPRYINELGFIDIVAGAKIYIEDPKETLNRLKKAFCKLEK